MAIELIILLMGISIGSCQTIDYCQRFGREHTMCQYPANSGCEKIVSQVDENAKADILRTHNKYRLMVANGQQSGQPGSSNMKEMIWDDELAMVAQRWANQCSFGHDKERRTQGFPESVGQNVAIASFSASNSTADFGGSAIKMWYDEVSQFNPSKIEPFVFEMSTGHYTQVVWADTYAVGCGYAYYKTERWNNKFYVCNYGPGGNMQTGSMYSRGAPCSQCTTSCSRTYPGLCQATNGANQVDGQ